MPVINLRVSGSENAELADKLVKTVSNLTADILNKKPEVTVVTVTFVPEHLWFVNSVSLADLKKKSFHLSINISDSTNLKDEKARYISAVSNSFAELIGDLHPVSYIVIEELRADAYGYDELTIEYKIITNRIANSLKK